MRLSIIYYIQLPSYIQFYNVTDKRPGQDTIRIIFLFLEAKCALSLIVDIMTLLLQQDVHIVLYVGREITNITFIESGSLIEIKISFERET